MAAKYAGNNNRQQNMVFTKKVKNLKQGEISKNGKRGWTKPKSLHAPPF